MKVKFTMPKDSGLKADFNIDKSNTIALKSELNAEIEARIEGDNNLQSEITRVENEIPDISGLATKAELQSVENEIPDISNLATKTELQEVENEIPVVNNGTLTIIQNGETKGVFRANDSNNVTVNLEAGGGGAVNSVNGQTGDVVLTANDIGALPNTAVIPTKTSDLTNNSGFITNTVNNLTNYYLKSETYTKLEVQQLIASIPKFTVLVVQALPVTGQSMTLYLLPKDGEAPDVYEEYIWVTETETYELIGSTAVDLDGYATEDWVEAKGYATETYVNDGLATKQNTLTAGTDLEIVTGSGGDSTVSGTTSIALNGASANGLNSVTLTGACEQRDILPSEYQRVEYLQSSGTQYIDTGIIVEDMTYKIILTAMPLNNTDGVICGVSNTPTGYPGILLNGVGSFRYGAQQSQAISPTLQSETKYKLELTYKKLVVNDTNTYTATGTTNTTPMNYTCYLFARNNVGTVGNFAPCRIYYFQMSKGDNVIANYIPCRRKSDSVLGMYDTVTGTFLINAGTGTFTAGVDVTTPSPDNVMSIWCNNGVLKVSPNLFDKSDNSQYIGAFVNANTGVLTEFSMGYCFCVPCKPNTTYTLSGMTDNSTWGSFTSNSIGTTATVKATNNGSLTTGANDKYLIGIAYTITATPIDYRDTLQLELGSTATSYMPYGQIYADGTVETVTDSNQSTATAEMLLSVGNYKDTQSILDGAVTRDVGIKVLDGSESWEATTGGYYSLLKTYLGTNSTVLPFGSLDIICTHYTVTSVQTANKMLVGNSYVNWYVSTTFTTLASWQQYLADQYVSGTPVIIVYPIATPTAETVTGQTLTTIAGNNTLTITQASIENLPIEANYDLQGGNIINFTNASGYQRTSNLVTSISSSSTNTQYPSAKCVYDIVGNIETLLSNV